MNNRDSGWPGPVQDEVADHLQFHQLSPAHWTDACAARSDRVLGVSPLMLAVPATDGMPSVVVRTPMLDDDLRAVECWETGGELVSGTYGNWRFRRSEHLLFGVLCLDEADFDPARVARDGEPDTALRRATELAYRELFGLLAAEGYPHLLRVWNYLPAINVTEHGLERYRQFNIGRQDAFLASARSHLQGAPAACALGSADGGLTVYFLAGRVPVVPIENPRQVSAYHYPTRYGPRSPTFSRAALARLPGQEVLFVSGTASIVGHLTLHIGDVVAQTREAMTNVEVVVGQANLVAHRGFAMEDLLYKVYIRHPRDLAAVRDEFLRFVTPRVRPVFVQADVCREDLLVEVEATAFSVAAT